MNQSSTIHSLESLDKDNITPTLIKSCQKFLSIMTTGNSGIYSEGDSYHLPEKDWSNVEVVDGMFAKSISTVVQKYLKPFEEIGYTFVDNTVHQKITFLIKAALYIHNNTIIQTGKGNLLQTLQIGVEGVIQVPNKHAARIQNEIATIDYTVFNSREKYVTDFLNHLGTDLSFVAKGNIITVMLKQKDDYKAFEKKQALIYQLGKKALASRFFATFDKKFNKQSTISGNYLDDISQIVHHAIIFAKVSLGYEIQVSSTIYRKPRPYTAGLKSLQQSGHITTLQQKTMSRNNTSPSPEKKSEEPQVDVLSGKLTILTIEDLSGSVEQKIHTAIDTFYQRDFSGLEQRQKDGVCNQFAHVLLQLSEDIQTLITHDTVQSSTAQPFLHFVALFKQPLHKGNYLRVKQLLDATNVPGLKAMIGNSIKKKTLMK